MNQNHHPLSEFLPHRPPMILIDQLVEFRVDFIHTTLTIRNDSVFLENGKIPAYISLEYMAQTIAVWRGKLAQKNNEPPQIGFLLGTRKLVLNEPFFKEGETLDIYGQLKCDLDEMASFDCWVEIQGKMAAQARVSVFQPDNHELVQKTLVKDH